MPKIVVILGNSNGCLATHFKKNIQTQTDMELVGGLLLWLADVTGIRWIGRKKSLPGIALRTVVYLVGGFALIVVVFTLIYS